MSLAFSQPWLLLALLLLPPLWWLMRRLPPSPRPVRFPGVRLLLNLESRIRRPSGAPLWLRLLRLAAVLLAILGLAEPRLTTAPELAGDAPLLLLIDGGWASAPDWDLRRSLAEELVDAAGRSQLPVRLAVLASPPEDHLGPATAAEWSASLATLMPAPWPPDRDGWADAVRQAAADGDTVHWIHDGFSHGGDGRLEQALEGASTTIHLARPSLRTLGPPGRTGDEATVEVRRGQAGLPENIGVLARDRSGRLVTRGEVSMAADSHAEEVRMRVALPLANRIASFHIEGERTAAATRLVSGAWRQPRVGILSFAAAEEPLFDGAHYVRASLAPFAETVTGDAGTLLARSPHSIVTLDTLPADAVAGLEAWVRSGGQLVRFAGPEMTTGDDEPLLPVRVLSGGRDLGGAMSWSEPQAISSYADDGPLAGLSPSPEARVRRQLLAAPDPQTRERTWARLEDGTPIITAAALGRGEVVLIHTTADTRWGTLPLTGDFARIMERIVRRADGGNESVGQGPWQLELALTALGDLQIPAAPVEPVLGERMALGRPGPDLPPGLYVSETESRTIAVEANLEPSTLPSNARVQPLATARSVNPAPWMLALAIILVALDTAVSAWRRPMAGATAALLLAMLAVTPPAALAQQDMRNMSDLPSGALQTTFAYVITGDARLDRMSEAGLYGLGNVLYRRTSVLAADPKGVDPAVDDLSLYPILYWPIRDKQPAPPDSAIAELNRFISTGGMLILDTGDQGVSESGAELAQRDLARLVGRVNLPPLAIAGSEHVLTRSFYLINEFPGRWSGGRIWVAAEREDDEGAVNDGVTPVVLGGSDWAAAWAEDRSGQPLAALQSGNDMQRELARRAGVNFVMQALTGNYKHDQIHQAAILERLQN